MEVNPYFISLCCYLVIIASVFSVSCKTELVYYQVRFNSNGGTTFPTQSVPEGTCAYKVGDPVREGYTFEGWYKDPQFVYLYDFTKPVHQDLTLYAKWSEKIITQFTVTYKSGDGTGSDVQVKVSPGKYVLKYNTEVTVSKAVSTDYTNFTKGNYSFLQWKKGDVKVYDGTVIDVTGDITVNATWLDTSSLGSFDDDGSYKLNGSGAIAVPRVITGTTGNKLVTSVKAADTSFNPTSLSLPVSVVEIPANAFDSCNNLKSVYFNTDEPPVIGINAFPTDAKFYIPESADKSEYADELDVDETKIDTIDYASEYFKVSFNSNGGSAVDSQSVLKGSAATKPADPTKGDYKFGGWYSNSGLTDAYTFTEPVTKDITLYAKWNEADFSKCVLFTSSSSFSISTTPGWTAPGYIEYSTDGISWKTWDGSSISGTKSASVYQIGFRGKGNSLISYDGEDARPWKITGSDVSVSGNIMTLLDYEDPDSATMGTSCFESMFENQAALVSAGDLKLSATALVPACYYRMFRSCEALVDAPSIAATELAVAATSGQIKIGCCQYMFQLCKSLKTAPELHATVLTEKCYQQMFDGCINLEAAPALSATKLATECYMGMFLCCTSLKTTPELLATNLAVNCYYSMFQGCTGLETAQTLPATTLEQGCYQNMFNGCSSLTTAPELPATTLANSCYMEMFYGCTSLATAPALPATTLEEQCYESIFNGCSNISSITVGFIEWKNGATSNWLTGSGTSAGTKAFTCPVFLDTSATGDDKVPSGWTVHRTPVANYITFTGTGTGDLSFSVKPYFTGEGGLCYSTGDPENADSWTKWTSDSGSSGAITADATTHKLYFAGLGNSVITGSAGHWSDNKHWSITGAAASVECSGNVMSLLDYNNPEKTVMSSSCFQYMFWGCDKLTSVSSDFLPATTLAGSCYYYMFRDCDNLKTVPTLPATTLAGYCYGGMFMNCKSLETAPVLSSTSLAAGCYYGMFVGCIGLETAPTLPATTLVSDCYREMFQGCTALETAPTLSATALANNCYRNMFKDCTKLATAPSLPAETLASGCYMNMFNGCTSLTGNVTLYGKQPVSSCYYAMFANTAITGCTIKFTGTEFADDYWYKDSQEIWQHEGCCEGMFNGCSALTSLTLEGITAWGSGTTRETPGNGYATSDWLKNAGSGSTLKFTCTDALDTTTKDPSHVPADWTVVKNNYIVKFDVQGHGTAPAALSVAKGGKVTKPTDPTATDYKFDGWFKESACTTAWKFSGETNADTVTDDTILYAKWTGAANYLTFTAKTAGSTVTPMFVNGSSYQYSTDNGATWNDGNIDGTTKITLAKVDDKVMLKGINCATDGSNHFAMTGSIAASGSVTSLTDGIGTDSGVDLYDYCYSCMFKDCTSLTTAPELPATTLASYCYIRMFNNTGLTATPALPAESLIDNCYQKMFADCTALTTATALPATTLVSECYKEMFSGCINLSSVTVKFTDWGETSLYATEDWLSGAGTSATGTKTFTCPDELDTTTKNKNHVPAGWTVEKTNYIVKFDVQGHGTAPASLSVSKGGTVTKPTDPTATDYKFDGWFKESACTNAWKFSGETNADTVTDDTILYAKWTGAASANYLTFTALVVNSSVTPKFKSGSYQYSTDNGATWNTGNIDGTTTITLAEVGDKVMLKGTDCITDTSNYFDMTGGIQASGSVTSLTDGAGINPDVELSNGCYSSMFNQCISLVCAPELPAKNLKPNCYEGMFFGCTSLISTPNLPATTLKDYCYYKMFQGCAALKVSEGNPSETYQGMIFTCPSTTSLTSAVDDMFYNDIGGGSFTGTPTAGHTYYWYAEYWF